MYSRLKFTLRQLYESIAFALESVTVNKTRTFLSLLGITIGIFAIISVYTAIDTLEGYIRNSLAGITSNVVQMGTYPWGPEEGDNGEYKWWKYLNRPQVTEDEFIEIQRITPEIKEASLQMIISRTIKYGSSSYDNAVVIGGTEFYNNTRNGKIASGRFLTTYEFQSGANSMVIGSTIAEELFDGQDPVGKTVKIGGKKVDIVGVFEKEGTSMFGASWDDQLLVPLNFAKTMATFRNSDPQMYVLPKDGIDFKDFKEKLRFNMRTLRRLPPSAESNFALNDVGTITKELDSIFSIINLAGGIIGIFSILVGGFGVANIMFVSVRERTSQIGIQKALGARPYVILLQFTFEAVLLSVIGGAIGLFLIWILTFVATASLDFEVALSLKNIAIGLGISSFVGAVSGIFPAYSAATMDPVTAIGK